MNLEKERPQTAKRHSLNRNVLLTVCCAVFAIVLILFAVLVSQGASATADAEGENLDLTDSLLGVSYPASNSWYPYVPPQSSEGSPVYITSNGAVANYYVLTEYPYSTKPQLTVSASKLDPENGASYTYADLNNAIKRIKEDEFDTVEYSRMYKMDFAITAIKLDGNSIIASYKMVLREKTLDELFPFLKDAPKGAIFNLPCIHALKISNATLMGKITCSNHVMTDYSVEYATEQVGDSTDITNLLDTLVARTHYSDDVYTTLDTAIKG